MVGSPAMKPRYRQTCPASGFTVAGRQTRPASRSAEVGVHGPRPSVDDREERTLRDRSRGPCRDTAEPPEDGIGPSGVGAPLMGGPDGSLTTGRGTFR